jgi:hypothetical protein
MMEKVKMNDICSSGLIANTQQGEQPKASGVFEVECYDSNNNLKWFERMDNLVVNVGLQYMAGTALDGTTSRITQWYLGLWGAGGSNDPAAGNTMASHGSWTENTSYTNATRPQAQFAQATTANPSVVTNTNNKASFTMNAATTVGGAFLTSDSVKGGSSGTLFSGADFSGGDRSVVNGDTIQVTYTFSLTA